MKTSRKLWSLLWAVVLQFTLSACGGGGGDGTPAPDTTVPTTPVLATQVIGPTRINLSWSASTDNVGVVGYNVLRDGKLIATVPGTTFSDLTVFSGGQYCVKAYDAAANFSAAACAAVIGNKFPIATTSNKSEIFGGAAFDGTNYLVGIQGDANAFNRVTAQIMSPTGVLIGARISTGRGGGAPSVAFNGVNYLMVWPDDANPPHPNDIIYGQLISTAGVAVTAPFIISVSVGALDTKGITCSNTKCTVIWTDKNGTGTVIGRDIDSTGSFLTAEYTIFSNTRATGGGVDVGVVCDGNNNCLFVTDTASQILGLIKGPTNNKSVFVIATKVQACNDRNPVGGIFDGTNYMVVWNDHSNCVSTPNWDVLAQRLDASGNLVGAAFQVNSVNTKRAAIPTVAFDGTNSLVVWVDGRNDTNKNGVCDAGEGTCWDIYGQYISKLGGLVGSEFVISADAGNEIGGVGFGNGKYLFLNSTDIVLSPNGFSGGDVYGAFLLP